MISIKYSVVYSQMGKDRLINKKHYHNNTIELVQFIKGEGKFLLGNHIYNFSAGDIFIYNGTVPHCTSPINLDEYCRNILGLDSYILQNIAPDINFNMKSRPDSSAAMHIDTLIYELKNMIDEKDSIFLSISKITEILHICYSNKTDINPITNITASKVIQLILKDFPASNCLDKISNQMHISKYHLCRKFKEETGLTIHTYIKILKINHAKMRLLETNDKISNIAYDLGFSDIASFTKAFKRELHVSPLQFRKSASKQTIMNPESNSIVCVKL